MLYRPTYRTTKSLPLNLSLNSADVIRRSKGNDSEQNLKTQDLLDRVVEFTASPGSRAFYQKAVGVLGLGLVEEAVGEVRMRAPESRARYLSALLSEWMGERTNAPAR